MKIFALQIFILPFALASLLGCSSKNGAEEAVYFPRIEKESDVAKQITRRFASDFPDSPFAISDLDVYYLAGTNRDCFLVQDAENIEIIYESNSGYVIYCFDPQSSEFLFRL